VPFVFIGGQQGFPEGLNNSNKLNFAPRAGISQNIPSWAWFFTGLWNFLHARGHEYLV